ncbi:MAG: hypothetical protein ACE5HL_01600 [Terriglobia bacterium]
MTIRPYFEKFDVVIGLVILLALVWFIANRWRQLRSPQPSSD